MLHLVVLLVAAVAASANVINENYCPVLKPVENFNLTAYQGTWYEISKYPNSAEKNGKCGSVEYKLDGEVLKVKDIHVVDGVQTYAEGTAKLAADANKAGKLVVSLKFGDVTKDSPLNILATDYTHYAIAHNCKYDEKNKNQQDFAWEILSRSKKLEGEAKTAVDNYLKANAKELDTSKFVQTDFSEAACKFTSTNLITEAVKHH
ncbi:bilin-binding protein-like [Cydia fagiglandana]|uniref:bilin-binding protein-like n=1 Tax=Cydia fagiglandana TaxID=1458189 RepID=UPI002FEE59BC